MAATITLTSVSAKSAVTDSVAAKGDARLNSREWRGPYNAGDPHGGANGYENGLPAGGSISLKLAPPYPDADDRRVFSTTLPNCRNLRIEQQNCLVVGSDYEVKSE
ncbi:MAG: hypothetical protein H7267_10425 [Sandarakinorhabdus sp.]|nr:hypothetical protein [Sandarakinorhabdus sp.]